MIEDYEKHWQEDDDRCVGCGRRFPARLGLLGVVGGVCYTCSFAPPEHRRAWWLIPAILGIGLAAVIGAWLT